MCGPTHADGVTAELTSQDLPLPKIVRRNLSHTRAKKLAKQLNHQLGPT